MASSSDLSRRQALLILGSLLAAGCAESGLISEHLKLLDDAVFGEAHAITREEVARFQAASISLKVGGLAPRLVLLSRIDGRDFIWRASRKVVIATRGGRLMATGGLRHNLKRTDLLTPDPVDGGLLRADGARSTRLLDLSEDYGVGIEASSEFEFREKETIEIIGSRIAMIRVTERVRVPKLSWRHKNTYWADAGTGIVWKSRQHYHPDSGPLIITTLRPARPA